MKELTVCERVLIVEDEAFVAMDLEAMLEEAGFEVVGWATNADEALVMAEQHRPHCALIDVQLRGGQDGIALAAELGSRFSCGAIFMTAQADPGTVERARSVAHRAYLRKPYRRDDVLEALRGADDDGCAVRTDRTRPESDGL